MFVEILKKSWQTTSQNRQLWLFGLFSSFFLLFATNEFFVVVSNLRKILTTNDFFYFFSQPFPQLPTLTKTDFSLQPFISFIIYLFFFIALLTIFILAEISLILSLKKVKEEKKITFKKTIKKAKKYFWPVSLVHLTTFSLVYLPFFLILSLFSNKWFKGDGGIFLFVFLNIFFLIILTLILFLLSRYVIFYLIIKKERVTSAIKKSILLLKKYWLKTLSLSFIIFLCLITFILLNLILFEGLKTPLRFGLFTFGQLAGSVGFYLVFIFGSLIIFALQILLSGFFTVYQTNCWLLFFSKIQKRG